VAVPCPAVNEDQAVTLVARWGEQFDVHPITEAGAEGELSAEQVAGYVAKYAIKGTEAAAAQVGAHVRVRGHFSTKSRRYSTTLGRPAAGRVVYAIRRQRGDTLPLDAWARAEDDQAVMVVASWVYVGHGYQTTGEAWLAASAAARAREARNTAKEELSSPPAAGVWRM
jgi:hypothetical protein